MSSTSPPVSSSDCLTWRKFVSILRSFRAFCSWSYIWREILSLNFMICGDFESIWASWFLMFLRSFITPFNSLCFSAIDYFKESTSPVLTLYESWTFWSSSSSSSPFDSLPSCCCCKSSFFNSEIWSCTWEKCWMIAETLLLVLLSLFFNCSN